MPPKRKRNVEASASSESNALDGAGPAPKKTRSNPARASRSKAAQSLADEPKTAPVKKPRAPRTKKAATASEVEPLAGPSQPTASSSAPAPSKKGRGKKKADPDDEAGSSSSQPEKRGAVFKPQCPQNIQDRVYRVMTQRIFMIDRQRNDGELREEFSVLGSTGNVYTVTIDRKPRCNCPDAIKNHCKHILFIFLKVLQVPQSSNVWYQKALLTSELEEVFRNAPLAPNSIAHAHIREAHARATGKIAPEAPSTIPDAGKKRIPGPDDDCPICYDGMHGVAETLLIFCEECGNALHKECFQQWKQTSRAQYKDLTCVWCRAKWIEAPGPGGPNTPNVRGVAGATMSNRGHGYLNLAGVAGISPVRDTSTYYHGPRAGQRYYGYRDYTD
ncbi:hypothetical protein CPB84DRAFT_1775471 [Gymnopilus junonius]|uniref:Uncharacterized protein n=1 Tax=Gymnopilus junonius TaxID=109634 RepID=A0A9P5NT11_GYMJU|nr:hypothetical protein CPB84DRAFT_1775471 [Gymnopilus junonius]